MDSCFEHIINTSSDSVLTLPHIKHKPLKLEYKKHDVDQAILYEHEVIMPFAASKTYEADISEWRRLSSEDEKSKAIYEISFSIPNTNMSYKPGDTIGVIPRNNKNEVELIINHLGLHDVANLTYKISIDNESKGEKLPVHIPSVATLRHVLTHCVDLRGVVKKIFLFALSMYTKEETEKRILQYLCSKEGFLAYTSHILKKGICLLDIFVMFKSCKPPIEVIFEHLPRLLPRPYSICNSNYKNGGKIKICFSVQDIGNNRKGLTTGWLEEIILNKDSLEQQFNDLSLTHIKPKVPIYFRKNVNEFHMPQDVSLPLILISPGTGVSPFIGFLEEREHILNMNQNATLGYVWLFNGCRNPKLDFIYKTELQNFTNKGVLNKIRIAFSRISNTENKYVQHDIKQDGDKVAKLITEGAHVFVCGDINSVVKEVKQIITKCIEIYMNITAEAAEKYITDMEREKRYHVDIWN